MKKNKVLLAEDDLNFGSVLKDYLELNDYEVTLSKDGNMGLKEFRNNSYDICILDVMMPEMDGFALAREIKKINPLIPLIFLTAKNLKPDVLEGFRIGADDYVTKPFDSEILLYKIKAVLQRNSPLFNSRPPERELFPIGNFTFNSKLRQLDIQGKEVKLSPKENQLLKMLCEKLNDVLTREEALIQIWGDDNYFTTRSMDVYITKLRKYLKDDPAVELVNLHGNGFRLLVKKY